LTTLIPPVIGPCGKRVYASKAVGKKLARRVNEGGRERVAPYHCTRCHGWHLGSTTLAPRTKRPRVDAEVMGRCK
jgi:hypothetical protein